LPRDELQGRDARSTGPTRESAVFQRVARFASAAWTAGVPQRAAVVALIVGTVLNLINQGEAVLAGGPVRWGRLLLTYAVPFVVSAHGALSARRR
jgi:hypothetical protein